MHKSLDLARLQIIPKCPPTPKSQWALECENVYIHIYTIAHTQDTHKSGEMLLIKKIRIFHHHSALLDFGSALIKPN